MPSKVSTIAKAAQSSLLLNKYSLSGRSTIRLSISIPRLAGCLWKQCPAVSDSSRRSAAGGTGNINRL